MNIVVKVVTGVVVVCTAGLLATGCNSSSGSANSATVRVVASTNVYGDIVKQVAGDLAGTTVSITSIISDPAADPHSYEANTRTQLELSRADLVIENGGGYDDFVDSMLKTAKNTPTVLNVVDLSGKQPVNGQLNEHVWYDFPTVTTLVGRVVSALGTADAKDAPTFRANGAAFTRKVTQLEATEASIKATHAGEGAAITEPVPLYLLQACGLVNRTPAAFSEGIEDGTDVPATVLRQTLTLFTDQQVKVLAYNEQTSGPETERVLAAAKTNHVAVVPVTETLPAGKDYLSWMTGNLAAISAALS